MVPSFKEIQVGNMAHIQGKPLDAAKEMCHIIFQRDLIFDSIFKFLLWREWSTVSGLIRPCIQPSSLSYTPDSHFHPTWSVHGSTWNHERLRHAWDTRNLKELPFQRCWCFIVSWCVFLFVLGAGSSHPQDDWKRAAKAGRKKWDLMRKCCWHDGP